MPLRPAAYTIARLKTHDLAGETLGPIRTLRAMRVFHNDLVDMAVSQVRAKASAVASSGEADPLSAIMDINEEETTAAQSGVGAPFDGSIIKAIVEFFESPNGKAIIDAIFALIKMALRIV